VGRYSAGVEGIAELEKLQSKDFKDIPNDDKLRLIGS